MISELLVILFARYGICGLHFNQLNDSVLNQIQNTVSITNGSKRYNPTNAGNAIGRVMSLNQCFLIALGRNVKVPVSQSF